MRSTRSSTASCFDPVAAQLINLFPLPNVPGSRLLQQQLHLERHPQQRRRSVRHPRRPSAGGREQSVRALQLPEHQSRRAAAARRSGGLGRLRQRHPEPRPECGGRLVARCRRRTSFNELRVGYNKVRSDVDPPGVWHRRQRAVRHQGRAEGSALLRRPAAHADRALRAPRRTVLPPAVPGLAGAAGGQQPDLAEGQPRAEVRRRVPARLAELHRPAIAQRRAELP